MLEGTHETTVEKQIAIGYRCTPKMTLFFVMSPLSGSTRPVTPYEMKFSTEHKNVGVIMVDCLDVIFLIFLHINVINTTKLISLNFIWKNVG